MKKRIKSITFSGIIALLIISLVIIPILANANTNSAAVTDVNANETSTESTSNIGKKIYLSDIDYVTTDGWSYNGWSGHNIEYDRNQDGGKLSLQVNGQRTYFAKGLSVHAKGQITYDISTYSETFTRFMAYMGVDAARGTNGDLWIKISVSDDGTTWQDLHQTARMSGATEAVEVDLPIAGHRYLRIYTDPCGSNGADHATLANACIVTADYDKNAPYYSGLHTVEYYDNILSNYSVEDNYNNNYRLVLEREFVNKLGYGSIQEFAELNENGIKTLDWCLSSNEMLEQFIEVGEIANAPQFLEILADLYVNNEKALTSDKFIYTKMAIALATTYTTDPLHSPLKFGRFGATYDYLERYRLMKQLFDENKMMPLRTMT